MVRRDATAGPLCVVFVDVAPDVTLQTFLELLLSRTGLTVRIPRVILQVLKVLRRELPQPPLHRSQEIFRSGLLEQPLDPLMEAFGGAIRWQSLEQPQAVLGSGILRQCRELLWQPFLDRLQKALGNETLGQALNGAEEAEDVLVRILNLQCTRGDLLVGGRGDVGQGPVLVEVHPLDGRSQDGVKTSLDPRPGLVLFVFAPSLPWLEAVLGRICVVVPAIPLPEKLLVLLRDALEDLFELGHGDLRRRWAPAVAVPQQHDEVGAGGGVLAASDLAQADVHRLLVQRGFLAHPPAQVNRLEASAVLLAQLAQPREHPRLQRVSLLLQVAEGGADKDAKGLACLCHQAPPFSLPLATRPVHIYRAETSPLTCSSARR